MSLPRPPLPCRPRAFGAVVAPAAKVRSKAAPRAPPSQAAPAACRGGCVTPPSPKFEDLMAGTQLLWPALLLFAKNVLF